MQSEEHKKALNQLEDSQNSLKIAQESLTKLETEKLKNKITTITISVAAGIAIGMIGSYFLVK
jgi:acid phosphatase family membrane protein YuiD